MVTQKFYVLAIATLHVLSSAIASSENSRIDDAAVLVQVHLSGERNEEENLGPKPAITSEGLSFDVPTINNGDDASDAPVQADEASVMEEAKKKIAQVVKKVYAASVIAAARQKVLQVAEKVWPVHHEFSGIRARDELDEQDEDAAAAEQPPVEAGTAAPNAVNDEVSDAEESPEEAAAKATPTLVVDSNAVYPSAAAKGVTPRKPLRVKVREFEDEARMLRSKLDNFERKARDDFDHMLAKTMKVTLDVATTAELTAEHGARTGAPVQDESPRAQVGLAKNNREKEDIAGPSNKKDSV